MDKTQVQLIAKRYKKYTLWLNAAMTFITLFACRLSVSCDTILPSMLNPLIVSVIFSLVVSVAYGEAWCAVALSSPANLAKFYLTASALKMLMAAVVFLVYAVVGDKANLLGFAAIFVVFYVVLLVFDCIYFARVEKKNK